MEESILIYLVDDEVLIAKSMGQLLERELSNVEIAAFHSPFDVIDAMDERCCDLLLTDIRMPGMTGLELVDQLKQKGMEFESIILTGYDMFEYSYEAIHQNAFSYLLKTESDETVIKTVKKAIHKIESRRMFQRNLDNASRQVSTLKQQNQRMLLRDYIIGETSEIDEDKAEKQCFLVLEHDISGGGADEKKQLLLQLVEGTLTNTSDLDIESCISFVLHECCLWCCFLKGNGRDLNGISSSFRYALESIYEMTETQIGHAALFVLSAEPCKTKNIRSQYERLLAEVVIHSQLGVSGIATEKAVGAVTTEDENITDWKFLPRQAFENIECGKNDDAFKTISKICSCLENEKKTQLEKMQLFSGTVSEICSFIMQYGITTDGILESVNLLHKCASRNNYHEKAIVIKDAFERITNEMQQGSRSRLHYITSQVKDYISAHISDDLSTTVLADYVGYSEPHLAKLFKADQGVTLHQYIQDYRLEQAKKMLGDTNQKIYTIAEKCGYMNTAYFIRVFRSQTGTTPQDYRNNLQAK